MSKPEAIVALGGPNRGSDLGVDTRARVEASMQLAVNEDVPLIIMSGAGAVAMRDYAESSPLATSLPPIEVETRAHDTIGDAHYTKIEHLVPRDIGSIVLCTADYHMGRAAYVFGRVLGEEYDVRPHPAEIDYSLLLRANMLIREQVALIFDNILLLGTVPEDDEEREVRLYQFHHDYSSSRIRFLAEALQKQG